MDGADNLKLGYSLPNLSSARTSSSSVAGLKDIASYGAIEEESMDESGGNTRSR